MMPNYRCLHALLRMAAPPLLAGLTPSLANAETFSLVVLPDTQIYSLEHPEVLESQMRWIIAERAKRNIVAVVNEGDIVHRNSNPEWEVAHEAYAKLAAAGIPFVLATGNHDYGPWGNTSNRASGLNSWFTPWDYRNSAKWGYFEAGKLDNTWHSIMTPWGGFLFLSLEFAPRDEVVAWADRIVGEHSQEKAVLITHAYLYNDDTRYDWVKKGKAQQYSPYTTGVANSGNVNDGEQLWQKLVSRHANFILTMNGHVLGDGTGRLVSTGAARNKVWQLLANYQEGVEPDRKNGGGGYLRILEFQNDGETIKVTTYSPFYDQWLREPDQEFAITTNGNCVAGPQAKPC